MEDSFLFFRNGVRSMRGDGGCASKWLTRTRGAGGIQTGGNTGLAGGTRRALSLAAKPLRGALAAIRASGAACSLGLMCLH